MAVRALIIAIENYNDIQVGGIAKTLTGTLQAGLDFKAWLAEKWKTEKRPESETQLIFCSEPAQAGGNGAASDDIINALLKLKDEGQNTTEELYVFFCGHGFTFIEQRSKSADVIITSDFKHPDRSAQCCIKLDEMIAWLRGHLGGPGRHYYFVDACRNKLDSSQISVGPMPPYNPGASGEASTFLIQSTSQGDIAPVGGPFPKALLAGLRGKGIAKAWDRQIGDAMVVQYESLLRYLKTALPIDQRPTRDAKGTVAASEAILATLRPIPMSNCTITVEDAPAALDGEIVYRRGRSKGEERRPLARQPFLLALEPDDYTFSLRLTGAAVEPTSPMPADLFDDRAIVFRRAAGTGLGSTQLPADIAGAAESQLVGAAEPQFEIVVPDNAKLTLRHLSTDLETSFKASTRARLPQGTYFATLSNSDGRIVRRQAIDLEAGQGGILNIAEWRNSAPHLAIARKLPAYAINGDAVDFSESLGGAVIDPDLDLWLALIGGGRILGSTGDYSKISGLPLRDFSIETPGASPIYILAGFENVNFTLDVALSRGDRVTWMPAIQPPDMPGIRSTYFAAEPGSQLVSFRINDQTPYTIASLASPNRGMLITLTLDEEENPRLSQYLLPLGHLVDQFPPEVRQRIESRNNLRDVRFLAQASRAFRKRRDLSKEVSETQLTDLFRAKWLDPIASSLASYEALRRGRRGEMHEVIENMKRFFSDVPDTAALARLSGENVERPNGTPLFLDGLRAFPDHAKWLPLPADHLDFNSPWTAWRAAVKG